MNSELLQQLRRVEQLAQTSRVVRLLRVPGRYLYALGFRLLRYRHTRRGVARLVTTFFGTPMTIVLPASTDIYLTGGKTHDSEIRLARFLIRYLPPGGVFADVGAHFGYFSLLAARVLGPQGQVVSFEASAATYAVLSGNVAPVPTITANHCAVSDSEAPVSFYEFPVYYNEYNSLDISQFEGEAWFEDARPTRIQVSAVTLDSFFATAQRLPDIIKVDVEGAEAQVVRGAQDLLRRAAPCLVLEYLAPERHNTSHRQAAELLAALGYQAHRLGAAGELLPVGDIDRYLREQNIDSDNFAFIKQPA